VLPFEHIKALLNERYISLRLLLCWIAGVVKMSQLVTKDAIESWSLGIEVHQELKAVEGREPEEVALDALVLRSIHVQATLARASCQTRADRRGPKYYWLLRQYVREELGCADVVMRPLDQGAPPPRGVDSDDEEEEEAKSSSSSSSDDEDPPPRDQRRMLRALVKAEPRIRVPIGMSSFNTGGYEKPQAEAERDAARARLLS
jgi:hypothetical protein